MKSYNRKNNLGFYSNVFGVQRILQWKSFISYFWRIRQLHYMSHGNVSFKTQISLKDLSWLPGKKIWLKYDVTAINRIQVNVPELIEWFFRNNLMPWHKLWFQSVNTFTEWIWQAVNLYVSKIIIHKIFQTYQKISFVF